jgi:DnaJ-domain-containing protein 1
MNALDIDDDEDDSRPSLSAPSAAGRRLFDSEPQSTATAAAPTSSLFTASPPPAARRPNPSSRVRLDAYTHYELLGVSPSASPDTIRIAYKRLAVSLHPDRRQADPQAAHRFALVSSAYAVLSDELRRAMYDIVTGLREHSEEEMQRLTQLSRQRAAMMRENMQATVVLSREKEAMRGGLLVEEAEYGAIEQQSLAIDVTVPLQCMVDESRLIINGGESKSWLPGFFDPCEGKPKSLYMRYRFRNMLHEVEIKDHEDLRIPMRGKPPAALPRGLVEGEKAVPTTGRLADRPPRPQRI